MTRTSPYSCASQDSQKSCTDILSENNIYYIEISYHIKTDGINFRWEKCGTLLKGTMVCPPRSGSLTAENNYHTYRGPLHTMENIEYIMYIS